MSKIQNVGLNVGHKIANPFKTSRNITTPNPFACNNFEGNTLQFADVFEGFEPKKTNRLRMITSSVAGSITKINSLLPESIVNFVNRIRTNLTNAWDYAKNTNVSDLAGIKAINNAMNTDIVDIGKGITNSISDIGNTLSDKMAFLHKEIELPSITLGMKGLSEKWNALINNVHHSKANKNMSVMDLRAMWLEENARMAERTAA